MRANPLITAIVQARMRSTRLPSKVMKEIMGKPILWHMINRIKWCRLINNIVIASTTKESDKVILKLAEEMGVDSYAGSEDDVLDRYYQAARISHADIIVRVTSDCPLIDPQIVDKLIRFFLDNKGHVDYVSNIIKPTYPDGIDTEVFSFATLEKAWKEARLKSEREHVTAYITKHPELFRLSNIENNEDFSHMRWTVDEERDFEFVSQVYGKLYKEGHMFYINDILGLLKEYPELTAINSGIGRNEGYTKSLKDDRLLK